MVWELPQHVTSIQHSNILLLVVTIGFCTILDFQCEQCERTHSSERVGTLTLIGVAVSQSIIKLSDSVARLTLLENHPLNVCYNTCILHILIIINSY